MTDIVRTTRRTVVMPDAYAPPSRLHDRDWFELKHVWFRGCWHFTLGKQIPVRPPNTEGLHVEEEGTPFGKGEHVTFRIADEYTHHVGRIKAPWER